MQFVLFGRVIWTIMKDFDNLVHTQVYTVKLRYNNFPVITIFLLGPIFLSDILHVFLPGYNNPYSPL